MFIVVLAEKDECKLLTCNTAANRNVTWKLNGDDLENVINEDCPQDGQNLTVKVHETKMGNYSCWSNGQMLSSVFLLIEAKTSSEIFFFISHSSHHSFKYSDVCIYNFRISLLMSSHCGLYRFSVPVLGKILPL